MKENTKVGRKNKHKLTKRKKKLQYLHGCMVAYTGWPKSHFTLSKVNKLKPNRATKIGYISNERPDLRVFLLMKNSFIL